MTNELEPDETFVCLEAGSSASYTNWYGANPAISTVQNWQVKMEHWMMSAVVRH